MGERKTHPLVEALRKPRRCSKCRGPRGKSHRYCNPCHAASMRAWRKTHPLSGIALLKSRARSYANTYQRRGKIVRQPCEVCGAALAEKHHDDYSKPLQLRWFCRRHHLEHERKLK